MRNQALLTDSVFTLLQSAMEWPRERKVILPALATLETAVRSVRSEVDRETYDRLADGLSAEHQAALDKLLGLGPSRGSLLGWVRQVPRSCSAAGILDLMQRVQWVRDIGLPRELAETIPALRLRQLAARGARHSVAHFRRFPDRKRHAILAAFALYITARQLGDGPSCSEGRGARGGVRMHLNLG